MTESEGEVAKAVTTRSAPRVGDLVEVSRLPAVISLSDLEALRARLSRGEERLN